MMARAAKLPAFMTVNILPTSACWVTVPDRPALPCRRSRADADTTSCAALAKGISLCHEFRVTPGNERLLARDRVVSVFPQSGLHAQPAHIAAVCLEIFDLALRQEKIEMKRQAHARHHVVDRRP